MIAYILQVITLVLYFLGTMVSMIFLLRRSEVVSKSIIGITGVGFIAHTGALASLLLMTGAFPTLNFHKALSFFSWSLVLVFLFVTWRNRLYVLGAFFLPLAFLSLVSSAILPVETPALHPVFQAVWIHVALSILGTVGFAVAFVSGIMYLMQERLLKSKQFNALYFKLPSLDFLDNLNQRSILLGFPFLTLGILMGAISAQLTWGSYLNWNAEQTWALVTWAFYLMVLMGRITVGWRAKKAAYLTIVGFAGVLLTFLGVILKGPVPPSSL